MDQQSCCFVVASLKYPDIKRQAYVMDFVVFGGSHASRKSRAMSHNSSGGEKKEGKNKNVAVDCDCR